MVIFHMTVWHEVAYEIEFVEKTDFLKILEIKHA